MEPFEEFTIRSHPRRIEFYFSRSGFWHRSASVRKAAHVMAARARVFSGFWRSIFGDGCEERTRVASRLSGDDIRILNAKDAKIFAKEREGFCSATFAESFASFASKFL